MYKTKYGCLSVFFQRDFRHFTMFTETLNERIHGHGVKRKKRSNIKGLEWTRKPPTTAPTLSLCVSSESDLREQRNTASHTLIIPINHSE